VILGEDTATVPQASTGTGEGCVAQVSGSMTELNGLLSQGRMTWSEREHGWIGTPSEILAALVADGYEECQRETTTSHRDCRPAGGVWQGINPSTGSVASAIWVARPRSPDGVLFIQIDGESVARPGREPDEEEGGQG
jgi:hypothetical protein